MHWQRTIVRKVEVCADQCHASYTCKAFSHLESESTCELGDLPNLPDDEDPDGEALYVCKIFTASMLRPFYFARFQSVILHDVLTFNKLISCGYYLCAVVSIVTILLSSIFNPPQMFPQPTAGQT